MDDERTRLSDREARLVDALIAQRDCIAELTYALRCARGSDSTSQNTSRAIAIATASAIRAIDETDALLEQTDFGQLRQPQH